MEKHGQHFLTDMSVLNAMVQTYRQYGSVDTVLEIGPGKGVLTKELVKYAKRVIAVEIDNIFRPDLRAITHDHPNLNLVWNDILQVHLAQLGLKDGSYSIAANLPYLITGQVLRQFLSQSPYPSHMVLLIQKEVAERIVADPGQLSILGLSVQAFSQPRIIRLVPPEAFSPKPKVHSAIVSIEHIRQTQTVKPELELAFFRIIKTGFAQKRKLLRSNFKNLNHNGQVLTDSLIDQAWTDLKLSPNARAQELSLEQWVQLVDKLAKLVV